MIETAAGSPAAGAPPAAASTGPPRFDVATCSGCGLPHGMGRCSRAIELTAEALRRRGAAMNWR